MRYDMHVSAGTYNMSCRTQVKKTVSPLASEEVLPKRIPMYVCISGSSCAHRAVNVSVCNVTRGTKRGAQQLSFSLVVVPA